jgi:ABC-type uncharacterized transport system substrate-binding protein
MDASERSSNFRPTRLAKRPRSSFSLNVSARLTKCAASAARSCCTCACFNEATVTRHSEKASFSLFRAHSVDAIRRPIRSKSSTRTDVDSVLIDSPQVLQNSTLIAKLLGDAKLPAIFTFTESVEAGGLMAYSFDLIELHKRAAHNIDAILRGAKPGDIPFYQVTKFELSINLKAAKQLGLTVPPALVAIADKVIE